MKKKHSIPKKIIIFQCPEKAKFTEHWDKKRSRNLMSFPHPWRAILFGPPNSGKTSIIKNMILHANPEFDKIYICHFLEDYTTEYDNLGDSCIMLDELPSKEDIDPSEKNLVILEDLDFKHMNQDDKKKLSRLFGAISSHCNTSVVLAAQDAFNIPPIARRCSNIWCLWLKGMSDLDSVSNVARKCNMKSSHLNNIRKMMNDTHDFLCVDLTEKTPANLRFNGYTILHKKTSQ